MDETGMTCRITDIEAGIRFRTNGRKVTAPQVNSPLHRDRAMGYVRIETSRAGRRGGYTRMTFGTIDDVTDARANSPGRRERAAKRDK